MSEPHRHGLVDDDGLVMPFVTVASAGGPHEDAAFTAGWGCGALFTLLALGKPIGQRYWRGQVREEIVPQLDLIAMHYNLNLTVTRSNHGWAIAVMAPYEEQP